MTYEEFQAELVKTPDLIKDIYDKHQDDYTKHLVDNKKMVVTTVEAYATDRQKTINDTTKKNHGDWEAKVAEIVGESRPDGVNGLTWLDQLKEQKKLIKASITGDPNSPDNQAKDQAITNLQTQITNLTTSLADEKKGTFNAKVSAQVGSAIPSLKFTIPAHIKDNKQKAAYQKDEVKAKTALFNSEYKPEAMTDGRILYKDVKGNAQVDDNGDPLSVEGIFQKNHPYLLDPAGFSQGGAGSADDKQNNTSPDYLGKTPEEIRAKLAEMGLALGTAKWKDARTKAYAAAGLKME